MPDGKTCIDIAILDQNPLLASGISALLERQDGLRATALSVSPDLVTRTDPPGHFDLVVVDPSEFPMTPQAMVTRLRDSFGDARLIAYSATENAGLARACLAHGFRAFLSKSIGLHDLRTAIDAVQSGAIYLDPRYADAILTVHADQRPAAPARGLTEREAYVLKSVAHGKSLKEIGYELALSSKTVETYMARGASKLNISGRRQIVEYAIRSGWV